MVDFSFKIYVPALPLEGAGRVVEGGARRGGCDFISPASFILRNIIQGRSLCQLIPILSPKRKMGMFYFLYFTSLRG